MKNRILTEAEVISNTELVKAIKAARPVGKPMTAEQAKAWLATL